MRTYIDRDGDPWFEIEPDRFICAESRDGAIHQAQDVGMGTSLENLRIVFGPLTEVTMNNDHELDVLEENEPEVAYFAVAVPVAATTEFYALHLDCKRVVLDQVNFEDVEKLS